MTFCLVLVGMLRHRFARWLVKNFWERRWKDDRTWLMLRRHGWKLNDWKLRLRWFLPVRLPATLEQHHWKVCYVDRYRGFNYCDCSVPRSHLCLHACKNNSPNEVNSWNPSLAVAAKSWRSHQPVLVREANGSKRFWQTIWPWARIHADGQQQYQHQQHHQHLLTE